MAADIIREAIIKLGLSMEEADLQTPEIKEAQAAMKEYGQEVSMAAEAQEALAKSNEESQRAVNNLAEVQLQAQEANLRVADAVKQAGEGAFGAARGFAFLAASNEESAAEMARGIAIAQGAFDIFKGGVDIMRGVSEANKALAAASSAATAAEALKATSITATGTAAAATTPQLAAMNLAMGPVGIAVAALSATAIAGVAIWRQYGDAGESALDRIEQKAQRALQAQKELSQVTNDVAREQDRFRGVLDPNEQLAEIQRELAGISIESPEEITGDFAERRARFERATQGLFERRGRRPTRAALKLDSERDLLREQLQAEIEQARRAQDLTEQATQIQIQSLQGGLDDITNPFERQRIADEIGELKRGLVESFRTFRDAILELQEETREFRRFRDLAVTDGRIP